MGENYSAVLARSHVREVTHGCWDNPDFHYGSKPWRTITSTTSNPGTLIPARRKQSAKRRRSPSRVGTTRNTFISIRWRRAIRSSAASCWEVFRPRRWRGRWCSAPACSTSPRSRVSVSTSCAGTSRCARARVCVASSPFSTHARRGRSATAALRAFATR